MLVAIGAAIGQRKWFPLTRDRQKLHDIQTIDDASRGPWGSINLIMSFGLQYVCVLSHSAYETELLSETSSLWEPWSRY